MLFSTGFAQTEFVVGDGTLEPGQAEQIQQAQQTIIQLGTISTKIDDLAEIQVQNLEAVAVAIVEQQNETQTFLIVVIIISNLSMLGLWWAIYLYFQSKQLLDSNKPRKLKVNKLKPEEIKEIPTKKKELLEWQM